MKISDSYNSMRLSCSGYPTDCKSKEVWSRYREIKNRVKKSQVAYESIM